MSSNYGRSFYRKPREPYQQPTAKDMERARKRRLIEALQDEKRLKNETDWLGVDDVASN